MIRVAAPISAPLTATVELADGAAVEWRNILESLFGYTTDVQLLELANLNHPLLKELIVQAPGTYHHSIIVGSLVEAAAARGLPLLHVSTDYVFGGAGTRPVLYEIGSVTSGSPVSAAGRPARARISGMCQASSLAMVSRSVLSCTGLER